MDTSIDELLTKYSVGADAAVTGIAFARTYGKKLRFSVSPQVLGSFLAELSELCTEDERLGGGTGSFESVGLPIAEVIAERTMPVIVHCRPTFRLTEAQRQTMIDFGAFGDDDFLVGLVSALQEVLLEKLEISAEMSELIATVEVSQPWTRGDLTSLSVRVIFPYCRVDVTYQRKRLRAAFIEAFSTQKVFEGLEVAPLGQPLQEIGEMVPIYRGKMDQAEAPMTLVHVYGYIGESQAESLDLEAVYNPAHYSYIYSGATSGTFQGGRASLPLFLSINFWPGETKIREVIDRTVTPSPSTVDYDEKTVTSKVPLEMIRNLLPLLSVERFNVEPYWRDIGQAIFNATHGDSEGLELFVHASAHATVLGRGRSDCLSLFRQCHPNGITVRTIGWYAREDSPTGYAQWHHQWMRSAIAEALTRIHDDVAEAVYRFFWLDYLCSGLGRNSWYKFEANRLVPQDDAVDLRLAITSELVPLYKKIRGESNAVSLVGEKDIERKQAETSIAQISKLIESLGNVNFRSAVIRAAQEKFYVPNFESYRDADRSKTSWLNGVVACCGDRAYILKGKPEDYMTKTTNVEFPHDLSAESPVVIRLMKWLGEIFPDPELLSYFLKDAASFLYGSNAEKLFRVWSGDGDNSKSMLVKLFQQTLGMYCIDFPVSFLTGKVFNSSGPTPELAQAQGTRVGFVCEPEGNEQIREGAVKRYTGGDRFFARFLNQNGNSIDATFKLILMCNRIPEFTVVSKALRNRFLYLPFLSTWVDDPPETYEEQMAQHRFKKDPFFETQISELVPAFAWLLVESYSRYKTEGLKAPPIVERYTKTYWEENDPTQLFINERLTDVYLDPERKRLDENATLSCTEIYPEFARWFKQAYPGITVPNNAVFRQDLIQKLRPQGKKGRWFGLKFIQTVANI